MPKAKRPNDIKEQVGLRLRAVRELMGLNQATFGNLIGVSETALGNWERGEKLADVLAMLRLQMRYDWPLEWFYAGRASLRDFELRQQLEAKARELGAVIGAPIAEYPNEVPTTIEGTPLRQPGARARRAKTAGTIHEQQADFD